MNFDDLNNPELQEKLKNAKTPEEIFAIAKEEGYELSNDQLESISGGDWCFDYCANWCPCALHIK